MPAGQPERARGARIETRHSLAQEAGDMTLEFKLAPAQDNQPLQVCMRAAIRNINTARREQLQAQEAVFVYGV